MRKSFKFRLYPTPTQVEGLEAMLETHRRLYNRALAERRDAWQEEKRSVSYGEQSNHLKVDRLSNPFLASTNFSSCQDTLRRLDRAFQSFFCRVKQGGKPGYPRFKSAGRFESVTFPKHGDGCKLKEESERVYFQFVGDVKVKLHRTVQGKIKTVSFKREADHWYVVFSCEVPEPEVAPSTLPPVGIDLGLKAFLVTSEGEIIEPPKYLRQSAGKLKKLQRCLARKQKGSANRKKAKFKVARVHRKIANQRRDFHYKTALALVRQHGTIAHEDLNVAGMARTRLAKSILDAGWSQFIGILECKAVEAGTRVVAVNPRNTSQKCSRCNAMPQEKLKLQHRTHHCHSCEQEMDRDWNAALNILKAA